MATAARQSWIGVVSREHVLRVFKPYRVDVTFYPSREAPIKPLVKQLSSIGNNTHRGAAFRSGDIEVPDADFALVADAMQPT